MSEKVERVHRYATFECLRSARAEASLLIASDLAQFRRREQSEAVLTAVSASWKRHKLIHRRLFPNAYKPALIDAGQTAWMMVRPLWS